MRCPRLSRTAAVLVLASAGMVVPVALAATPGPPPIPIGGSPPVATSGVSATLSSTVAGAKPVVVSLVVQAPLVCGRPLGTTTVTLPAAADVPAAIAAASVTVNTLPATKVAVSGSTVTIGGPALRGMMCHSVIEGPMRVVFTRAAGLGNPGRAGTYAVEVKHGADLEHGTFTIR